MPKLFEVVAEEQGWSPDTQVGLLLEYIANQGDDALEALGEYAEQQADDENADAARLTEGPVGWEEG
jgi:hypothetical protein